MGIRGTTAQQPSWKSFFFDSKIFSIEKGGFPTKKLPLEKPGFSEIPQILHTQRVPNGPLLARKRLPENTWTKTRLLTSS